MRFTLQPWPLQRPWLPSPPPAWPWPSLSSPPSVYAKKEEKISSTYKRKRSSEVHGFPTGALTHVLRMAQNGVAAHGFGVRVQLDHDSQVLQRVLLQDPAANLLPEKDGHVSPTLVTILLNFP